MECPAPDLCLPYSPVGMLLSVKLSAKARSFRHLVARLNSLVDLFLDPSFKASLVFEKDQSLPIDIIVAMMKEVDVSTAAFAVAIIALIMTISQVLGQFLATADGYRRCRGSVMGSWAKLTRRRFRWGEIRFETLYSTPRFGLFPYTPQHILSHEVGQFGVSTPHILLDGSPAAMRSTFCEKKSYQSNELVSWIRFIEALHYNSRRTLELTGYGDSQTTLSPITAKQVFLAALGNQKYLIHDMRIEERSWDFVPPEVVRPLAVVSVSDIAIMVRRLGMLWKKFDPLEGIMRAEGNGFTVTSTFYWSIGMVLQIGVSDPLPDEYDKEQVHELYIPSEAADKMGFGIVPGQAGLNIPDYKLGTEAQVLATVREIDPTRRTSDTLESILKSNPGWTPGISDIIGFACPMMRQLGSSLIRIPQPSEYVIGLTQQEEGFVVFHRRLRDLIADRDAKYHHVSDQIRFILRQYEKFKETYGAQWEDQHECNKRINDRSVEFLDDVHQQHEAAVEYFKALQKQYSSGDQVFRYTDLMYSHIRYATNYFPEAMTRINAKPPTTRDHYGMRVAGWITEGAHIYFDNIPKVTADMKNKGFDNVEVTEEAWLTMMWKAFLWHRSHFMVPGLRIPSSNWGSRLAVYIG